MVVQAILDSTKVNKTSGFKQIVKPVKSIWKVGKSSFSRESRQLQVTMLAATIAAYFFDESIDATIRHNRLMHGSAKQIDNLGKHVNDFTGLGLFITGWITRNSSLEMSGKNILTAMVSTNILGSFAWYAIGRQRPLYSENNHQFKPFKSGNLALKIPPFKRLPSFPSMHAIGNFSLASVIGHQFGHKKAIPLYLFGTVVGFSRMAREGHYLSDIVAGAALGYLAGNAAVNFSRFKNTNPNSSATMFPSIRENRIELTIFLTL